MCEGEWRRNKPVNLSTGLFGNQLGRAPVCRCTCVCAGLMFMCIYKNLYWILKRKTLIKQRFHRPLQNLCGPPLLKTSASKCLKSGAAVSGTFTTKSFNWGLNLVLEHSVDQANIRILWSKSDCDQPRPWIRIKNFEPFWQMDFVKTIKKNNNILSLRGAWTGTWWSELFSLLREPRLEAPGHRRSSLWEAPPLTEHSAAVWDSLRQRRWTSPARTGASVLQEGLLRSAQGAAHQDQRAASGTGCRWCDFPFSVVTSWKWLKRWRAPAVHDVECVFKEKAAHKWLPSNTTTKKNLIKN